jgi:hypothetical protein
VGENPQGAGRETRFFDNRNFLSPTAEGEVCPKADARLTLPASGQGVILSEPAEFAAPWLRGKRIQAASRRICISFFPLDIPRRITVAIYRYGLVGYGMVKIL